MNLTKKFRFQKHLDFGGPINIETYLWLVLQKHSAVGDGSKRSNISGVPYVLVASFGHPKWSFAAACDPKGNWFLFFPTTISSIHLQGEHTKTPPTCFNPTSKTTIPRKINGWNLRLPLKFGNKTIQSIMALGSSRIHLRGCHSILPPCFLVGQSSNAFSWLRSYPSTRLDTLWWIRRSPQSGYAKGKGGNQGEIVFFFSSDLTWASWKIPIFNRK